MPKRSGAKPQLDGPKPPPPRGPGSVRKPTTKGGTSHVRNNNPPAGAQLHDGKWLRIGGTNAGGSGRPRNAVRLKFKDLLEEHGFERVKEMLAGKKLTFKVKDKSGKERTVTELVFPKESVILQAVDLAARIAKVVGPETASDDSIDLPSVEFTIEGTPPDAAEIAAAEAANAELRRQDGAA